MLTKIDFFDLTVKLIPSLAIKTRNLTKLYTNTIQPINNLENNNMKKII